MKVTKIMYRKYYVVIILLLASGNQYCNQELQTFNQLDFCLDDTHSTISYRATQHNDYEAIYDLSIKTFARVYNYTTQEQVDRSKKVWDIIIQEEVTALENKQIISYVATCNERVIGYISVNLTEAPNEMYLRQIVVDASFQHQGIGKRLIQLCLERLPNITRMVLMTHKKNYDAPKFYEYFGGKRVESPIWQKYLPNNLNAMDFVGYEFAQTELRAFHIDADEKQLEDALEAAK